MTVQGESQHYCRRQCSLGQPTSIRWTVLIGCERKLVSNAGRIREAECSNYLNLAADIDSAAETGCAIGEQPSLNATKSMSRI
jgi:hypothetical protein